MLPNEQAFLRRVLVIDDNLAIHEDFRKILCPRVAEGADSLDSLAAALFGEKQTAAVEEPAGTPRNGTTYEVDSASQGKEGLEKVIAATKEGRPYQLAFVDMRMPPGWDGVETIKQLWKVDPLLQTVICTAYSDYTWMEIRKALGDSDRLLILKKPFDTAEIAQISLALTEKYRLSRLAQLKIDDLRTMVDEQTAALRRSNDQLEEEVRQRRVAEERLRHDVLHDRLTGLPNRVLLADRVDQCIKRQDRESNYKFGILFIDMDEFKIVNDSLGHEAGDQLLVDVAARIAGAVRGTDTAMWAGEGITSRLGGDEFVVLLDGIRQAEDARVVAERILSTMVAPFTISGHEVMVRLSIGIATSTTPGQYVRAADILRDADTAVYSAKGTGKHRVAVFDSTMLAEARERLELEQDLRHAVNGEEIKLYYQPIISMRSGQIVGCEALLRWQHPTRGMISPLVFIPLAEATGLIVPLGLRVCREAVQQVKRWRTEYGGQHGKFWVSVNLSGTQLHVTSLPQEVENILRDAGLDHSALRLEVTEGMMIRQGDVQQETLRELKDRNITLLMDDFGTGYSSLGRLHELPIGGIKIDRAFISTLTADSKQSIAAVKAIVMLAHTYEFSVVAEGIETEVQLEHARTLGCDFGQGYYFSKPVPAEEMEKMLKAEHALSKGWDVGLRKVG